MLRHLSGQHTKTPIIYKLFACPEWKNDDSTSYYAEQREALYSVLPSLKNTFVYKGRNKALENYSRLYALCEGVLN